MIILIPKKNALNALQEWRNLYNVMVSKGFVYQRYSDYYLNDSIDHYESVSPEVGKFWARINAQGILLNVHEADCTDKLEIELKLRFV